MIHPKIITLSSLKTAMSNQQYLQAFNLIRTHKLDFNLLHDLDPQTFTSNIEGILTAINNPDHINLLISQLQQNLCLELLAYIMPQPKIQ